MKGPHRFFRVLLLATFPLSLYAGDLLHAVTLFHQSDKDETYEIHLVLPALPGDPVSPPGEAQVWLERFAAAVAKDDIAKGHINARTEPHEDRENENIRQGRWIVVAIVLQGETEISVGFAVEIRYSDGDLLSFQHRFRSVGDIADPLSKQTTINCGFTDLRSWSDFLELRDPLNQRQLNTLLLLRPWICGEVGEIKKLLVNVPDPLFLVQVMHQTMVDSEVLRVSRVVPTEIDWIRWQFAVQDIMASGEVERLLSQLQLDLGSMVGPQPALTLRMNDYFRQNLFTRAWQPFVRISRLYTQISGPAAGGRDTSAKARLLEGLFGLPSEPRWIIQETDEFGTAGIVTRIHEFTVPYYEIVAARSLQHRTQLDPEREMVYHPTPCARALSTLENHLRSHVKRDPLD
jgi:hypothetical protein